MREAVSELSLVTRIFDLLGKNADLHTSAEQLAQIVSEQAGIRRAWIVLGDSADGERQALSRKWITLGKGQSKTDPTLEDACRSVLQSGQIVVREAKGRDLDTSTDVAGPQAAPVTYTCLPISQGDRIFGVLALERSESSQPSEDEIGWMRVVAAGLAQSIQIRGLIKHDRKHYVNEASRDHAEPPWPQRQLNVIGASRAMLDVYATIEQVARTRATILLLGETGTGKEVIAKAIHITSNRRDRPFIRVNCSALSGQLLESELFGHVQGAFTGAVRDKVGRFEAAHGGTILLDEISTMELPLQVKLLRVLQEREIERVGDVRTIPVDVRIIAATNEDLAVAVTEGRFRQDLFYRLNVVTLELPALRDRREDIPRLVDHFLEKYNAQNDCDLRNISQELMDVLLRYPWPGNVRELENTIERAVVLSRGPDFTENLLPPNLRAFGRQSGLLSISDDRDEMLNDLVRRSIEEADVVDGSIWDRVMNRVERSLVQEALERCDQVKIKAADLLGINRNTLNKKCRELGLSSVGETATPDAAEREKTA